MDAGGDSSSSADAGVDAEADSDRPEPDSGRPIVPAPTCHVGVGCEPSRGCRGIPTCLDESEYEIGSAADPISDLPSGGVSLPMEAWTGGYCTNVSAVDEGGCDPNDAESCGGPECARCADTGQVSASGSPITVCLESCVPSLTNNDCREGYACILDSGTCQPGCVTDDECRVVRADTNGDGVIRAYDPIDNPDGDRLVYDATTNARCNPVTAQCEHDGAPLAEAGDGCVTDFGCEADGACLREDPDAGFWRGGYCTKFGCALAGNACAGDGVCGQVSGSFNSFCLEPCDSADGCGEGLGCWDTSVAGIATGGRDVCFPGCLADSECRLGERCEGATPTTVGDCVAL